MTVRQQYRAFDPTGRCVGSGTASDVAPFALLGCDIYRVLSNGTLGERCADLEARK